MSYSNLFQEYTKAVRKPHKKIVKIEFLQPDNTVAFALGNSVTSKNIHNSQKTKALVQDGSVSVQLQNGQRRKATITLSNLDDSFSYNVNKIWYGQRIRIMMGIELSNGEEFVLPQGVFYIQNPTEIYNPTEKTVTLNLVDKWAYLDGSLMGQLETAYTIPRHQSIGNPETYTYTAVGAVSYTDGVYHSEWSTYRSSAYISTLPNTNYNISCISTDNSYVDGVVYYTYNRETSIVDGSAYKYEDPNKGEILPFSNYARLTEKVSVTAGKTYTFSGYNCTNAYIEGVVWYDDEDRYIGFSRLSSQSNTLIATAPQGAHKVGIDFLKTGTATIGGADIYGYISYDFRKFDSNGELNVLTPSNCTRIAINFYNNSSSTPVVTNYTVQQIKQNNVFSVISDILKLSRYSRSNNSISYVTDILDSYAYLYADGTKTAYQGYSCSNNLIPINGGDKYTFSGFNCTKAYIEGVVWYDKNDNFVSTSRIYSAQSFLTATAPPNATKVGIDFLKTDNSATIGGAEITHITNRTVNPQQMYDNVVPCFSNYWANLEYTNFAGRKVPAYYLPYDITVNSDNSTFADLILELNEVIAGLIGYDSTGTLRIEPSQDNVEDNDKPILWEFTTKDNMLCSIDFTTKNSDVYNEIICIGTGQSGFEVYGKAQNYDEKSDTNINRIGVRTKITTQSSYWNAEQCIALAKYELKKTAVLQKSITIECLPLYHLSENNLITVQRNDKPNSPIEKHLIQGFTLPIGTSGTMTIQCTSVNDSSIATTTSSELVQTEDPSPSQNS